MKNNRFWFALAIVLMLLPGCSRQADEQHHHEHGHAHEEQDHDQIPRGPHGGRLFEQGDFALELAIFEENTPPEYRAYSYLKGEPVPPEQLTLSVSATRLGGTINTFTFTPYSDALRSKEQVEEPHSFDVAIDATYNGSHYHWSFSSYEGRTTLTDEAITSAEIVTEKAGPANIRTILNTNGQLIINEDLLVHVIPRFPGVAKEVNKKLGDTVEKGEVLASIESNQSLQPYEIRSPIRGTVISRHITTGEFAAEGREIFSVADLSSLWADFRVYRRDFAQVRQGQKLLVHLDDAHPPREASISYVSPFGEEATQSRIVRAVISNTEGTLYPGLFVKGEIVLKEELVPLAVKDGALQSVRGWTVVFIREGNTFEIRPVTLGRSDGIFHEVLAGLTAGADYATENSFVLKADLLKSGAAHEH